MGGLSAFSLTVALTSAFLFPVYHFIVAPLASVKTRRIVILAVMLCSLLLVPVSGLVRNVAFTSAQHAGDVSVGVPYAISFVGVSPELPRWPFPFAVVVAGGMAVAFMLSLPGWIKMALLIGGAEKMRVGKYVLALTDSEKAAPFSWGRWIVCSKRDYSSSRELIMAHEVAHLNKLHWVDLLMANFFVILTWYNPLSYLLVSDLKDVHEYEADSSVLRAGFNRRDYMTLLIKMTAGSRFPPYADSLNHSQLKKRFTMMKNQNSSPWRRWCVAALIPAAAMAVAVTDVPQVSRFISDVADADSAKPEISAVSERKVNKNSSESVFGNQKVRESNADKASEKKMTVSVLEVNENGSAEDPSENESPDVYLDGKKISMDEFKKISPSEIKSMRIDKSVNAIYVNTVGDAEGQKENAEKVDLGIVPEYKGNPGTMMKQLSDNIKYPEEAEKNGWEGVAVVRLIINPQGKVVSNEIVRGSGHEVLDNEALRATKELDGWIPSSLKGKTASFVLPVRFSLYTKNKS